MKFSISALAHGLVQQHILSQEACAQIDAELNNESVHFLYYLIHQHGLSATKIAKACATYYKLPYVDLHELDRETLAMNALTDEKLAQYQFLPMTIKNQTLTLGIADPDLLIHLDELTPHTHYTLTPVIINYNAFCTTLNKYLSKKCYHNMHATPLEIANITHFMQQLITDATIRKASDIHIEPERSQCRIRIRVDGVLHIITSLAKHFAAPIISHIKVLANIDIAEKRLPQDGRFTFSGLHGRNRDCRVSTCPTLYGEKCVIRLLDPKQKLFNLNELGLEQKSQTLFSQAICKPQGLILVTGPTGSGKTLTLYAALNKLNTENKNISTVEDPIEIQLPGINQVNIHPKAGLDFQTTLRAFLRQDPDIIMLGEIRDKETAQMAIRAAQTGHLVLSTLHTNNAIEAITRLTNMGVEPFNIINSLSIVIAQRLIRKLCRHCRTPCNSPQQLKALNELTIKHNHCIYQANQCPHCHQGYVGRVGIFEVAPITTDLKNLLFKTKDSKALLQQARQDGMQTLWQAALQKVAAGITSLEEAYRVAAQ